MIHQLQSIEKKIKYECNADNKCILLQCKVRERCVSAIPVFLVIISLFYATRATEAHIIKCTPSTGMYL